MVNSALQSSPNHLLEDQYYQERQQRYRSSGGDDIGPVHQSTKGTRVYVRRPQWANLANQRGMSVSLTRYRQGPSQACDEGKDGANGEVSGVLEDTVVASLA